MKTAIPTWLKTDPLVCHVPDFTIFSPQRRIVYSGGIPQLLDVCDRPYPLANCDRLDLRYLQKTALLIGEDGQQFTMYCDRQLAVEGEIVLVITNGIRKVGVKIPPLDEVRKAAESLVQMFDGAIVEGNQPTA